MEPVVIRPGLMFRFDSDQVRLVYAAARAHRGDRALILLDPSNGVCLSAPGQSVAPAFAIGWEVASDRATQLLADSWGPGSPAMLLRAERIAAVEDPDCVAVELLLVPGAGAEFSFLLRKAGRD